MNPMTICFLSLKLLAEKFSEGGQLVIGSRRYIAANLLTSGESCNLGFLWRYFRHCISFGSICFVN